MLGLLVTAESGLDLHVALIPMISMPKHERNTKQYDFRQTSLFGCTDQLAGPGSLRTQAGLDGSGLSASSA
jgi:hypothetical protein